MHATQTQSSCTCLMALEPAIHAASQRDLHLFGVLTGHNLPQNFLN